MKTILRTGPAAALLACALSAFAGEYTGTEVSFGQSFDSVAITSFRAGDVVWSSEASEPIAERFSSINFQGRAEGPEVGLEASLFAGGDWGEWVPAYVKRFPGGRFWGSFAAAGEAGTLLKLRFVGGGTGGGSVSIYEVNTRRDDVESVYGYKSASARHKILELPTAVSTVELGITSRPGWNAVAAKRPYEPMLPLRITVHHTETPQPMTKQAAIKELQVIQDYHMSPRGRNFHDIGYQFLIDGAGNIYQGRPEIMVGAHVAGSNEGNLGISLMGRFHPPGAEKPTPQQLEALTALTRWLAVNYGIPAAAILAHRDQAATACPGDNLYRYMAGLRQAAAAPGPAAVLGAAGGLQ